MIQRFEARRSVARSWEFRTYTMRLPSGEICGSEATWTWKKSMGSRRRERSSAQTAGLATRRPRIKARRILRDTGHSLENGRRATRCRDGRRGRKGKSNRRASREIGKQGGWEAEK